MHLGNKDKIGGVISMTTEMRKTGIDVVGDMPWGTHFCVFYETKADLLEMTVAYCKAGLQSQEFCLWVVAEPIAVEDARRALKEAVPDFDRYFADRSIEIVRAGRHALRARVGQAGGDIAFGAGTRKTVDF